MTTTQQFIEKARAVHGDTYDYSKSVYVRTHSKIIICCATHGDFFQSPNAHVSQKQGCPNCSSKRKKQTCLKNHGVENPSQSLYIQEKKKQTCLKNHGVEYPQQSKDVQLKREQNTIDRYGVKNPSQSLHIQEKKKQTMIDRYGVENYRQSHMRDILPFVNDHNWLFDQYVIQQKTATQIADELKIGTTCVCDYLRKHNILIRYKQKYSQKGIAWLTSIMNEQHIVIQHAKNDTEFKIPGTRYKVDGYCAETNTIYEFYGDRFHGNLNTFLSKECCHPFDTEKTAGELYQSTIKREQHLCDLGYTVVTMWESDWNQMKDQNITPSNINTKHNQKTVY